MNEHDWQGGGDSGAMLAHIEGNTSARKLRLFACACVRRYWSLLRYPTQRAAVETAERFADELAGEGDLQQARERDEQEQASWGAPEFEAFAYAAATACCVEDSGEAARNVREFMRQQAVREAAYELIPGENEARINAQASVAECRAQADLLREMFGNPFRPGFLRPEWLRWSNGAVGAIARELYEDRRYGEMPYLADALLDAGCTDESVLRHCSTTTGHVVGCWVLDLVLGKS